MSITSSHRRLVFEEMNWKLKRDFWSCSQVTDKTHIPLEAQRVLALLCFLWNNVQHDRISKLNTFLFFSGIILHRSRFLRSYAMIYILFSNKVAKSQHSNVRARRRRLRNFPELVRIYYFSCPSSLLSASVVNQKLIPSQRWWVAGYANRWRIADWPQSRFDLEMEISRFCFPSFIFAEKGCIFW